ncbi:hypothetical protein OSJ77_19820 [Phyllobacterium sp. 0TCS1.6C]|uniref:hypothetical protein n=1 Tax=unclassified Phyllobacterium TaxID=2638441 RepID=UPI0022651077|nr:MULTISPECIES: hypothetical protein [unclassified Phyllobacterium]MCX8282442.1 hypothetical protein [Phyllobacterium sp. 0TCS1.6C]MCX8292534.1 hypothetical protein [Phyllobacterium sp. 0TCS1.6A]
MNLFVQTELAVLERLPLTEQLARLEQTLAGPLPDIGARAELRRLYLDLTEEQSKELAA